MPVDFFAHPCTTPNGNCSTTAVPCCSTFSKSLFGISDASASNRVPAVVLFDQEDLWDFTIENLTNNAIQYKAIDFCIPIYRTGAYNVNDDNSNPLDFSSDHQGTELIKRCEGFLFDGAHWILFFEIKTKLNQGWLTDARRKFEETILSFKEHHPDLKHQIINPIISNKAVYKVPQNEMIQSRILKDKTGVSLQITTRFSIE
ncbi:hypothetical protein [Myroides sp. WP-1]|uniref:hypothetical protein n=1 Tax=Myroides sp. WP-1 TaxID=2759944 RepID=UPI001C72334F|nr:hypothetical protein [Myroides sp. WP-1]